MARKQRKLLMICIGVIIASYIVRSVVIGVLQMRYYQQQAIRAAQQRAKQKPKPSAAKTPPATPAPPVAVRTTPPPRPQPVKPPPSPFAKLSGVWRGRTALDGRGICDLKFELTEKPESGHFSGYSTMTCTATGPLVAKRANPRTMMLNRMAPEASILSGKMESGSIHMNTDQVVGADSNGCAASAFLLSPFGSNQLAAEWQEQTCAGGHIILRKTKF